MFSTCTFTPLAALIAVVMSVSPTFATIWNVSTTAELTNAIDNSATGDEIVVASGTYNLEAILELDTPGITLRGATGNRDDVVLVGGGVANHVVPRTIIYVANKDITIKDLTVSEAYWNGIHLRTETEKVSGILLSNVKIRDIGQRYIKGSKGSITNRASDVTIENCYLVQTKDYIQQPGEANDYIGGIDAMVAKNWIIRDNVFEGIQGEDGEARGALFLWQGGENVTIERNVFINNDRSIALGNAGSGNAVDGGIYDMDGGIIRNNTVLRYPGGDIGVELVHTKDLKVYNNTFYSQNTAKSRLLSILDHGAGCGGATTGLDIRNNIIRGDVSDSAVGDWSAADLEAMGNLVDESGSEILENWFVDAPNGDFHLTKFATGALGLAPRIPVVLEDMDRDARPARTDFGADQVIPITEDSVVAEEIDSNDLIVLDW